MKRLLTLMLAAIGLLVVTTGPARAGTDVFCGDPGGYIQQVPCSGPEHTLTSVVSDGEDSGGQQTCAYAVYQQARYGNLICATLWACHTYGGLVIYPYAVNITPARQNMIGHSSWGSTPAFNGCPRGSYLSASRKIAKRESAAAATPRLSSYLPAFQRGAGVAVPTALVGAGISPSSDARSVATAKGPALVSQDPSGQVCVSIKDPVDGWGLTCADAATAKASGVQAEMIDGSTEVTVGVSAASSAASTGGIAVSQTAVPASLNIIRGL